MTIYTLWGAFCLIVSSPIAVLNLFSELNINFANLTSTQDLADAFQTVSLDNLPSAIISALAGWSITTVVSVLYLGPAFEHVKQLLVRGFNTIKKTCTEETGESLGINEVIIVLWAFCSSVPPAQMYKETFAFLGDKLSYIPFTMQLLNSFAIRCSGIESLLTSFFDKDQKFINQVFKDLSAVKTKTPLMVFVDMDNANVKERVNNALLDYLSDFYDEKNNFFLNATHFSPCPMRERIQTSAMLLGVPISLLTVSSVYPLFTQKSIVGMESIFDVDIARSAKYQNATTFLLGTFLNFPATVFNLKAAYDLPFQYLSIINGLAQLYEEQEYARFSGYLALIALTGFFSYEAALGIKGLMIDVLQKGYLDYLGMTAENIGGKLITYLSCYSFMVYGLSTTSRLIDQSLNYHALEKIEAIDFYTAITLLSMHSRELDLSQLRLHPYFAPENTADCVSQISMFTEGLRQRMNIKKSVEENSYTNHKGI